MRERGDPRIMIMLAPKFAKITLALCATYAVISTRNSMSAADSIQKSRTIAFPIVLDGSSQRNGTMDSNATRDSIRESRTMASRSVREGLPEWKGSNSNDSVRKSKTMVFPRVTSLHPLPESSGRGFHAPHDAPTPSEETIRSKPRKKEHHLAPGTERQRVSFPTCNLLHELFSLDLKLLGEGGKKTAWKFSSAAVILKTAR